MNIECFSEKYTVRRLADEDIEKVLELCKRNPLYYKHCPPEVTRESIAEDMRNLPPKKNFQDKYYLGYFQGNDLVAVMDFIDKYPNDETVFIGFFMVNSRYQQKGIGSSMISELSRYMKQLGYRYIRLGYGKGNRQSRGFWEKNEFSETGTVLHQERYDVVVMQRVL